MKQKQIMALLLSGTLTLGAVSPVMAAEPAENIPAVETTANTETTAEAVETPKVEKESPTTGNTTPEYPKMMDSLAASLNDLALSVAKDYWALSDTAKQNVKKLLENDPESANFLGLILAAYPNGSTSGQIVTVEELQKSLYDEWIKNPNVDMDGLLTSFEEDFVSNIDALQYILQSASDYAENYSNYWLEELRIISKQLSSILYTTPELYLPEYLTQLETCNGKLEEYITNLKNDDANFSYALANGKNFQSISAEANTLLSNIGKNLNTSILTKGKNLAASYKELYDLGSGSLGAISNPNADPKNPKPATDIKVFESLVITDGQTLATADVLWKDTVSYFTGDFSEITDILLQGESSLNSQMLNDYYSYGYGNLVSAYNLLASAVMTDSENQAGEVAFIGYTGNEKTAYDAALATLKTAVDNKDYSNYATAGKELKTAAKAYVDAAKKYALEQAEETKTDLVKKLENIQSDIMAHKDYYNETYLAEVTAILEKLEKAPIDETILKLFEEANAILAKQSESYSESFKANLNDAAASVETANKWWSYLSETQKSEERYANAIPITNALKDALVSNNGVYNIDTFKTAYNNFQAALDHEKGAIYLAAKSAMESLVSNAETIYQLESKKDHNKGVLEAYAKSIAALKESIKDFDYANSSAIQSTADALLTAQNTLLNDKPVVENPKPEVPQTEKPKTETPNTAKKEKKKNEVHTGDMANAATPGLFGLFSLAGIVSVFGSRRKK